MIIGRIAWRLSPRSVSRNHAGWQGVAAHTVHLLLYVLLGIEVVLGWNFRWAQGEALSFFGLFTIPAPAVYAPESRHLLAFLHYWTANAIMILAALHAVAALAHHYVLRDDVLLRMTGRTRAKA